MSPITQSTVKLVSVNLGVLQNLPGSQRKARTGIFKEPTAGPVAVEIDGLAGDHIGSVTHHGGPDQGVYIYSAEDYSYWERELGRSLPFGTFGENLTVSSLGASPPRVGDHWQIGPVALELTAPRIPCATLAMRMGDPGFVKRFARANRGGAYARVLRSGSLQTGMDVAIVSTTASYPAIDELFAVWHRRDKDPQFLKNALESPLASRLRQQLEIWLERLTSTAGAGERGDLRAGRPFS